MDVEKILAVCTILFKSLNPLAVGSVTNSARFTPESEAMTGQPMPGEPSMMA
jgi:hypothetical protein